MDRRTLLALAGPAALALAGCGAQTQPGAGSPPPSSPAAAAGPVVLYSGRDEKLIAPIIEKYRAASGQKIEVRYGNSAEMAAQIVEEGAKSPADVFYSQEVGAVGALAKRNLLGSLPTATVEKAAQRFRPRTGTLWVGISARSRVIVYNAAALKGAPVPTGAEGLTSDQYAGKVAVVPGNAGFQAFITGFRVAKGDTSAADWLKAMKANKVITTFESNGDVLTAVEKGELPIGLINHYYWAKKPASERAKSTIVFPTGKDAGGLVNATAAAVTVKGAGNPAAVGLIDYLLSAEGQQAIMKGTAEYPVVAGIGDPEGIPPLADLQGPDLDLADLDSFEATQKMLTAEGYLS